MDSAITSQWIDIAPGYAGLLALPPARRGPGLVLLQEIFGVNRHIRALVQQYALDGFVVLAPDLFWRTAPHVALGYEGDDLTRGRALGQVYTPEQAIADLGAATQFLRARPETARRVGAVGYCMGGRMAWLAAATAGVDAAVAYYGGGIHLQLERAAGVRCPLQFHFAGHDEHIPPAAVEQVRAATAALGAELHVYADAHHGFNCWERGSYHAASAALAHGRTLAFLARHLF